MCPTPVVWRAWRHSAAVAGFEFAMSPRCRNQFPKTQELLPAARPSQRLAAVLVPTRGSSSATSKRRAGVLQGMLVGSPVVEADDRMVEGAEPEERPLVKKTALRS